MRNGGQIQNFQQGKQLRTSINQYLFRKLGSNATIIQLPISKNTQILLLVLELTKKKETLMNYSVKKKVHLDEQLLKKLTILNTVCLRHPERKFIILIWRANDADFLRE